MSTKMQKKLMMAIRGIVVKDSTTRRTSIIKLDMVEVKENLVLSSKPLLALNPFSSLGNNESFHSQEVIRSEQQGKLGQLQ